MKLCMIGTGYVGLVSGVCFSDVGNTVYCVDKDKKKIDELNKGNVPIYEPGLEEILKKNYKQNRLKFTTDLKKAVSSSDIIFICVGTPTKKNSNSANLKYVFSVAKELKKIIKSYKIIITKSTVPVTTGDKIENILKNLKKKKLVDIVSNPEFLREGEAIRDFVYPDRVIIGTDSNKANKIPPIIKIGAFDLCGVGGETGGRAGVFFVFKNGLTLLPFCKRRIVLFAINLTGIAIIICLFCLCL